MTDLQVTTETVVSDSDRTWVRNPEIASQYAVTRTFVMTDMVEAVHYPNGILKPGLFVARYTGGARSGLWAPYYDDWTDATNTGLNTLLGVIYDGGEVRKNRDGTLVVGANGNIAASVLLVGTPAMIIRSNLPAQVLEDGSTPFVPDAADIATLGMIDDDEGVDQ